MAQKVSDEPVTEIDEAQAALRDGLERAHELVCDARLILRRPKSGKSRLPIPTEDKPE